MMRNKIVIIILSAIIILGGVIFFRYETVMRSGFILSKTYAKWKSIIDLNDQTYRTIKGIANITIAMAGTRYSAKMDFVLEKPEKVSLNVHSTVGDVTFVANQNLWLYLPSQHTVIIGIPGIPMWSYEPSAILEGFSNHEVLPVSFKKDSFVFSNIYIKPQGEESVQGKKTSIFEFTIPRNEKLRFEGRAKLWIYKETRLPYKCELKEKTGKFTLEVVFNNLEVNSSIGGDNFIFNIPPKTTAQFVPKDQMIKFIKIIPRIVPKLL